MAGISSIYVSRLHADLQEIVQYRRADARRPFGVKRRAVEVALLDDGRERHAVARNRARIAPRRRRVAVNEIGESALSDAGEQRRIADGLELVPAHLRHRQVWVRRETPHLRVDDAETGRVLLF